MMGLSAAFGICLFLLIYEENCTLGVLFTDLSELRSWSRNLNEEIPLRYFILKVQIGLPRLAEEFSTIM